MTTTPNPDAVVVDANLIVHGLLPGEFQQTAQAQLTKWRASRVQLHAPTLWRYEVTSALSKSVHFDQITDAEAQVLLQLVENFSVALHPPTAALSRSAYDWTRKLQRAGAYDSFYIALAESMRCQLWTLDQRLVNAAGLAWVKLLVGTA